MKMGCSNTKNLPTMSVDSQNRSPRSSEGTRRHTLEDKIRSLRPSGSVTSPEMTPNDSPREDPAEAFPRPTEVVRNMTVKKWSDLDNLDAKIAVYERKLRVHREGSYKHEKYSKRLEMLEYRYGLEASGKRKSFV